MTALDRSDITRVALLALAMTCALHLPPREAGAQRPDTAPVVGGPGIIVGLVVDTLSNPVDGVQILVGGLDRSARSGPDGTFRITDVPEGDHDIRARRIGYAPASKRVRVGRDGGRVILVVQPVPAALQRVVTSVERSGLSGVVSDTAFHPLVGVQIRVMGDASDRAVTDSTGTFFVPLDVGRYILEVSAEGFESRLVSLNVPADSGRWMAVMLRDGKGPTNRERIELRRMRSRLAWRSRAFSRFFTREDLADWGARPLEHVVRMGAVRPFHSYCQALVDGGPDRLPIWYFDADELEGLEVYENLSLPRTGERGGAQRGCPIVYVWLRR